MRSWIGIVIANVSRSEIGWAIWMPSSAGRPNAGRIAGSSQTSGTRNSP